MSNSIAPGSLADVNVKVTALTTNPNVPVTYKTIIIKKNLVNGVNTLTQEMMSAQNAKYVIKYDYTLGEDITVPENCILEFDGGSILGMYTLTGTNTSIKAEKYKIFNAVSFSGTWNVLNIYDVWFGDSNSDILQRLISLTNDNIKNIVYIDNNHNIDLGSGNNGCVLTSNTIIELEGTITLNSTSVIFYNIFQILNKENITIEGSGSIVGDVDTHVGSTGQSGFGINIEHSNNILIKGITVSKCWGDGIYIGGNQSNIISKNISVENVEIHHCRRQGISVTYCDGFIFKGLNIHDISGTAPQAAIDIEPNLNKYVCNGIISNSKLIGTKGVLLLVQNQTNMDISNIEFNNCYINATSNSYILEIFRVNKNSIKFVDCHFDYYTDANIYVHECNAGINYITCTFGNSEMNESQFCMLGTGAHIEHCISYGGLYIPASSGYDKKSYVYDSILYGKKNIFVKTILEHNVIYGGVDIGGNSYIVDNKIIGNKYLDAESFYGSSKLLLRNGCVVKDNKISYDGETSISVLVSLYNDITLDNNELIAGNAGNVIYRYSVSGKDILIRNSLSGYYVATGLIIIPKVEVRGTTRPTLTSREKGTMFFDETLNKPIWYDGNATTGWIDATGTPA